MVRVNLIQTNNGSVSAPLDFTSVGNLTIPLSRVSTVSVVKYSLPNSETPLMEWDDQLYQFALRCEDFFVVQNVPMFDTSLSNNIMTMTTVCEAFNRAFQSAVLNLNALIPLPTQVPPWLEWNTQRSLFNIQAPSAYRQPGATKPGSTCPSALGEPIEIWLNYPLSKMFQSFNISAEDRLSGLKDAGMVVKISFLCDHWNDATSQFNMIQESQSLCNFIGPRFIYISTSSMPCGQEIFVSPNASSGQSYQQIIASFTIPYDQGLTDQLTNLDFTTVTNGYRPTPVMGLDLRDVRANVYYTLNNGQSRKFMLPPGQTATIILDFQ